jgi:hypothetical protein
MQFGEFGFLSFGLVQQTAAVLSVPIAAGSGCPRSSPISLPASSAYELAAREVRPLNPEAEEIISHPPAAE